MIMSIATELTRIQTAKANIKTAIESKGVTVPSATTIDGYPSLVNTIQTFDPYAGHDYVEIGGLKWATMNIGANSVTDYGLYFQWGDTAGYTSGQCGSNSTANKKPFYWNDCVLHNGTSNTGATTFTKYYSTGGTTVLDDTDDAAVANWGGNWRMPTTAEFQALGAATTSAWTTSYEGSGVPGLVLTDKTDSSKKLFFPAAGYCVNGSFHDGGRRGYCWSSSLYTSSVDYAYRLYFESSSVNWQSRNYRCYGFSVRPVLG
jgi:uncharacterized protein (TIGR02145 family)